MHYYVVSWDEGVRPRDAHTKRFRSFGAASYWVKYVVDVLHRRPTLVSVQQVTSPESITDFLMQDQLQKGFWVVYTGYELKTGMSGKTYKVRYVKERVTLEYFADKIRNKGIIPVTIHSIKRDEVIYDTKKCFTYVKYREHRGVKCSKACEYFIPMYGKSGDLYCVCDCLKKMVKVRTNFSLDPMRSLQDQLDERIKSINIIPPEDCPLIQV